MRFISSAAAAEFSVLGSPGCTTAQGLTCEQLSGARSLLPLTPEPLKELQVIRIIYKYGRRYLSLQHTGSSAPGGGREMLPFPDSP